MKKSLQEKFKNTTLLALDFDGVMTDGSVFVNQKGEEFVRCSRKDGMGINLLKKAGMRVIVISTEKNPVVSVRCKKLDIPCIQGAESGEGKAEVLKKYMQRAKLGPKETAYMGDDINDIAALKIAGLALTVADGNALVKNVCDYITVQPGGKHAVREVCELLLKAKHLPIVV